MIGKRGGELSFESNSLFLVFVYIYFIWLIVNNSVVIIIYFWCKFIGGKWDILLFRVEVMVIFNFWVLVRKII